MFTKHVRFVFPSGENVEEAFLDTAKKIYQNIQDGRYVRKQVLIFHEDF